MARLVQLLSRMGTRISSFSSRLIPALLFVIVSIRNNIGNIGMLLIALLGALCAYLYLDNSCMRRWEGFPVQTRWSSECQVKIEGIWQSEVFAVNYLSARFARDGTIFSESNEAFAEQFKGVMDPDTLKAVPTPPPVIPLNPVKKEVLPNATSNQ